MTFSFLAGMRTSSRRKEKCIFSGTDFAECIDEGGKEKCKSEGNPQNNVKVGQILEGQCGIDGIVVGIEGELISSQRSDLTVLRDSMGLILRVAVVRMDWTIVAKENDFAHDAIFECGFQGFNGVEDGGVCHANGDKDDVGVGSMRFNKPSQRGKRKREVMRSSVIGSVQLNFGTERSDQFKLGKKAQFSLIVQMEIDGDIAMSDLDCFLS